jgi:nitrogen fixation NifU-like protein
MAYSEKVLDHYDNPRNVGKMDMNDKSVGTGMVGAPACGDVMKLDEARAIKNIDIVEELSLPPVKIHCSVLAEDAIKSAIKDYTDKNRTHR